MVSGLTSLSQCPARRESSQEIFVPCLTAFTAEAKFQSKWLPEVLFCCRLGTAEVPGRPQLGFHPPCSSYAPGLGGGAALSAVVGKVVLL